MRRDDKMTKAIRTKSLLKQVHSELQQSENEKINTLEVADLLTIFEAFVYVLAKCLKSGTNVIFDRFFSFYTKPIKKKTKVPGGGYTWTFDKRVRFRPYPIFRSMAETKLSELEYEELKK